MRAGPFRLTAGLLAVLACCVVDDVRPEGRPCTAKDPCGPGALCSDGGKCVPRPPDGMVDRRGADLAVPDQAVPDQMLPDRGPDGPPDADGDGIPDSADNCPKAFNLNQADDDGDKLGNVCDNCPQNQNPLQENMDGDAYGDICDTDIDDDGLINSIDPLPLKKNIVYYWAAALGSQAADFATVAGWAPSGSNLCQQQVTSSTDALMLQKTVQSDFMAEAKITPSGTPGTSPAVGLVFRMNGSQTNGYACYVDLKNKRVVLGKITSSALSELKGTIQGTVPTSPYYKVRVTAAGSSLTCADIQSNQAVTQSDPSYPAGGLGLFASDTAACFEYLFALVP